MVTRPPRSLSWWQAALLTAFAVAGTFAFRALAAGVQAAQRGLAFREALREVSLDPFNLGLAQAGGFAVALAVGLRWLGRDVPLQETLRIRPARPGVITLALVAGAALQFPLTELANLLRELDPMPVQEQVRLRRLLTADGPFDGVAIVLAVIGVAPVAEELLFRGLMLPALGRRYRPGTALGASAVLFGAIHVDPVMMVYATVAGLVLGLVALRTGSTPVAVATHAAFNAVPVLLSARVVPIRGFNTVSEEVFHLPLPLVLGPGIIALAAVAVLVRLADVSPR